MLSFIIKAQDAYHMKIELAMSVPVWMLVVIETPLFLYFDKHPPFLPFPVVPLVACVFTVLCSSISPLVFSWLYDWKIGKKHTDIEYEHFLVLLQSLNFRY